MHNIKIHYTYNDPNNIITHHKFNISYKNYITNSNTDNLSGLDLHVDKKTSQYNNLLESLKSYFTVYDGNIIDSMKSLIYDINNNTNLSSFERYLLESVHQFIPTDNNTNTSTKNPTMNSTKNPTMNSTKNSTMNPTTTNSNSNNSLESLFSYFFNNGSNSHNLFESILSNYLLISSSNSNSNNNNNSNNNSNSNNNINSNKGNSKNNANVVTWTDSDTESLNTQSNNRKDDESNFKLLLDTLKFCFDKSLHWDTNNPEYKEKLKYLNSITFDVFDKCINYMYPELWCSLDTEHKNDLFNFLKKICDLPSKYNNKNSLGLGNENLSLYAFFMELDNIFSKYSDRTISNCIRNFILPFFCKKFSDSNSETQHCDNGLCSRPCQSTTSCNSETSSCESMSSSRPCQSNTSCKVATQPCDTSVCSPTCPSTTSCNSATTSCESMTSSRPSPSTTSCNSATTSLESMTSSRPSPSTTSCNSATKSCDSMYGSTPCDIS